MKTKTKNTKTEKLELITTFLFSAFFFGSIVNAILSTI